MEQPEKDFDVIKCTILSFVEDETLTWRCTSDYCDKSEITVSGQDEIIKALNKSGVCDKCNQKEMYNIVEKKHSNKCSDCNHVHSGKQYGYICIGCPCERTEFE